ncbi:MAG: thioredoxin domain-containing protein [Candidatus Nanopelagicales bacterium]
MGKNSGQQGDAKSTKDKAAAARAESQAAEKRRERLIRIIGGVGVLVVVVAIIGVAIVARSADSGSTDGRALPDVNPAAALPTGVLGSDSEYPYALPYGTGTGSAPVLQLWEDFQCPACAQLELINGSGIKELATTGQVQLLLRPTAFLDRNLNNTSSAEAINAWGCAVDQGKTAEYSGIVFANQPTEGAGFSLDQLIGFGEQAGITGSQFDSFSQCVNDGTYLGWAVNSTDAFYANEVRGTPTGYLNGQELDGAQLADQAQLQRLVDEASGN